jgi:sigma-B regulation protein RsbU (phosphoserine phosphatase)
MTDQMLQLLRAQVGSIVLGSIFLFTGMVSCGIALVRGRGRMRLLLWFGLFNAMYGVRILAQMTEGISLLPRSAMTYVPYLIAVLTYLISIPALMFWLELSLGKLRRFMQASVFLAVVIGTAGVYSAFTSESPYRFMPYNKLLVIWTLLTLAVIVTVPKLAKQFLGGRSWISLIGTLLLVVAALHSNLKDFLRLAPYPLFEPLAFLGFVFSMGYVAAAKIFTDERRLLSIEKELEIAQRIQTSILPASLPELERMDISAAYRPMTSVAGDFYEFVVADRHHAGFLVADVSGHGVPAALIASMIKVAMQTVAGCLQDPGDVLRGLNRVLSGQLHGQFVTAAYLWLDTETLRARYSAAGHPPLLHWCAADGALRNIESNGLLFGMFPDTEYPVCEFTLGAGDRLLLYTDGLIEPENASGEAFGESRLEQVLRAHLEEPVAHLSSHLLTELQIWQPNGMSQQDDITLIVIDVS